MQALSGRGTDILGRMGSTNFEGNAAVYALLMFILPTAKTLVEQAYFYRVQCINMSVKAALTTAVYAKAVRLSAGSKGASTSGEIMNLMQLDSSRLGDLITYLHVTWSAVIQVLGYLALLYGYLGWSTFGGLTMMIVLIPLQVSI